MFTAVLKHPRDVKVVHGLEVHTKRGKNRVFLAKVQGKSNLHA